MFKDYFDESELSERTKKIVEKVAKQIIRLHGVDQAKAMEQAEKIIKQAGISIKEMCIRDSL